VNFTLAKTLRVPSHCRPVRCWTLKTLLLRLGLPRLRNKHGNWALAEKCDNPYAMWDVVRTHWKKIRRHLHPDANGSEKRFARLCEIYFEIKRRVLAMGVLP
jgi:hypothetical protein